jgi:hypothetical protein
MQGGAAGLARDNCNTGRHAHPQLSVVRRGGKPAEEFVMVSTRQPRNMPD